LTDEQIEYAGDDVRYLREIYLRQHETLSELGRLEWLEADFAVLTDPARYRPDPESAWTRIKRINTLKGVQLAVARSLAAWREREAMTSDRPRRWVLADEPLLDLARRCPAGEAELERIRGLSAGQVGRHGQALLACIREARDTPRADWPQPEMRIRLEPPQEALADAAMAIVRLCGHEHAVSPGSLASRRDVEALIAGQRDASGLTRGWRYRIAGESVEQFLAGTTCLQVSEQRLAQRELKPD
jgi:ribonuclease D